MGRVYLPTNWLRKAGVPVEEVADPRHRSAVAVQVRRLLKDAERLYRSGDEGLVYLPFRAAWAISAARRVYSEIGRRVISRGPRAWDSRTIVPLHRKLFVMGEGVLKTFGSLPARVSSPWKPATINAVWRLS
jgi:phytoene synthase